MYNCHYNHYIYFEQRLRKSHIFLLYINCNSEYKSRRCRTDNRPAPPSSGWRTVTMRGAKSFGIARDNARGSAEKWSTRNSNKSTAPGFNLSAHAKAAGLGIVPTT